MVDAILQFCDLRVCTALKKQITLGIHICQMESKVETCAF